MFVESDVRFVSPYSSLVDEILMLKHASKSFLTLKRVSECAGVKCKNSESTVL